MYLGIPYGAVDSNNPFGTSKPAPAFEGIFNAIDDSAACLQIGNGVLVGSLDCLHLSVFVPSSANTTKLPVLLFIHGGGFEVGSYGRHIYGPKFLVRYDIILVTFNYRLGVFGYMCTDNPRVPGNQASKDQLLALRWVRDNIGSFGGDPDRVTLSGNSAGAASTDLQIIRQNDGPKLFQQAILQSGVAFLPSYPPTVRNSPLILAQHFNFETNDVDDALDFLATVDPLRLLIAGRLLGLQFRPCIEREFNGVEPFMTENWPLKEVIPTAEDLNIMVGFNENEALALFLLPISDLSNIVNASVQGIFAIDHEDLSGLSEIRQFYFGDEDTDETDETQFKNIIDLISDTSFFYNSMMCIDRYLKSAVGKVYLYLFSYDGERNILKRRLNTTLKGAAHGDEIGYLFDVSYLEKPNEEDQLTVDRMTEMWANFVKYGDPTPVTTPILPVKWELITPTSPYHYMHIGAHLEAGTRPFHERMAFWDLFYEKNRHLQRFVLDNAED